MYDGPWFFAIAGASICAASFMVTLWLTEPQQVYEGPPVPQRIERLLKAQVFSRSQLDKEAQSTALFTSLGLRAVLDGAVRRPDGKAELYGWAANPGNDGSPIDLVVFIKGRGARIGKTQGPREDVARALNLPELAARNVLIKHSIECPLHEEFMLVAIDEKGGYFALAPRYCP